MSYVAPMDEQRFALETSGELSQIAALPRYSDAGPDLVRAILCESAKLAAEVFAPLNQPGDEQGAQCTDGTVRLPPGFTAAYAAYVDGEWGALGVPVEAGGQGLPFVVASVVQEQLTSANMSLSMSMLLAQGAIAALTAHASPELRETYVARLMSGQWTATMNLTEPQAGSDVGAVQTRATRTDDGTWRVKGTKIFISWGEHDAAENIVHLVLARTPGAPSGTKGISLFLVPKLLLDELGAPARRNDLRCVSIEHKLGLRASPTCTMSFGDNDACMGYLVGAENGGMRAMFSMMNHARINVGLQGVATAERAYQAALGYARERIQFGRLIEHPDVRRTLLTMKSVTEAIRALCYWNAASVDRGRAGDAEAQALADLLTPITKAYASDMGVDVASMAIQIFGGMGFIEESGIAQCWRDARITTIYEGTNGIQGLDLVNRKLPRGRWRNLFEDIRAFAESLPEEGDFQSARQALQASVAALEDATIWISTREDARDAAAGATVYSRMCGITISGYLLARQAQVAQMRLQSGEGEAGFLRAKITTARFFAEQIMPEAVALLGPATRGAQVLYSLSEDQFVR